MRGKWVLECVKFFIKEELDTHIDFSKRGLWYQEEKTLFYATSRRLFLVWVI